MDDKIKQIIQDGTVPDWDIVKRFLCHTQAVKRYVKLVTEAAMKVCAAQPRD